jgi:hypothetical protein
MSGFHTYVRLHTGQSGVQIPMCKEFLSFPKSRDWLWGPANLLFSGCRAVFPGGKAAAAWSWPVPKSKMSAATDFRWIILASNWGLSSKMPAISHLNHGMGGSCSACLYVAFLYLPLITLTYFKCLLSKNITVMLFRWSKAKQPNPAQWMVKRSRDVLIFHCVITKVERSRLFFPSHFRLFWIIRKHTEI